MNYFQQNRLEILHVKQIEEPISIAKEDYILIGKIDVVLERNGATFFVVTAYPHA